MKSKPKPFFHRFEGTKSKWVYSTESSGGTPFLIDDFSCLEDSINDDGSSMIKRLFQEVL